MISLTVLLPGFWLGSTRRSATNLSLKNVLWVLDDLLTNTLWVIGSDLLLQIAMKLSEGVTVMIPAEVSNV